MTGNMASTSTATFPSVADFVQQISSRPFPVNAPRLAIGNPAGDADSIICAIGTAYVDTTLRHLSTVPVVSIPLPDLQSLRPETKYLFSLAGIHTDTLDYSSIMAIDDPAGLPDVASVTLVDHNQLTLSKDGWKVEEILDHHMDEGVHTDTCQGKDRMIAYDAASLSALVASSCTLTVEQWDKHAPSSPSSMGIGAIPPSLSILLLGVILLDSINLSTKAGKATERDKWAVETLRRHTDWSALNLPAEICVDGKAGGSPDPTKLFDTLQSQKFQPEFWNGLTALQALKLDYKSFNVGENGGSSPMTFGVSSVLQSMSEFLRKPDICKSLAENYFPELKLFGIMFMTVGGGAAERQIMLASPDESMLQKLVQFLQQEDTLRVGEVGWNRDDKTRLFTVSMEQGNAKASRKQVVPILMDFFRKSSGDVAQ